MTTQIQPLSVPSAIRARRSIRHYDSAPLPEDVLEELLSLTVEAPSSWNVQARSVVAVTGEAGRQGLSRATGGQPHPTEAPVTLVFVADSRAWSGDLDDIWSRGQESGAWNAQFVAGFSQASLEFHKDLEQRGLLREYAVKDAMIAATYAMLSAASLGLASSPMNGWDEAEVKKVLGIADRDELHIALLLPVGYPAETRLHPGRRPLPRHAFRDRHGYGYARPASA
ncbi:nitroreductase family protein [Streptomyces sp. NPDC102381]|uniref:nitroreductase family protein n=1 Tax=Streptomyces sp. NPDC102381 TaxID=3366164 RepID=UPI00381B77E1